MSESRRSEEVAAQVVGVEGSAGTAETLHAPAHGSTSASGGSAVLMLALATLGFGLNFWAWALLSPLGPMFQQLLHLSPFEQALVVAVPVIVGSLGRIPVGALTDRFGGRVMFPLVSFATIVPVLFLGLGGHSSLPTLLSGGFLLGLAGTAFAVGVPFVNDWFSPARRGFAIGIGMGGTAISALRTVKPWAACTAFSTTTLWAWWRLLSSRRRAPCSARRGDPERPRPNRRRQCGSLP